MKIELNQEVFLVGIGNNARYKTPTHLATVSKIGRKWFYIDCPDVFYIARDSRFSLEDGLCDGKEYMPKWQIYESEEAYNETLRRPALLKEVENKIKTLTNTQLEHILTTLI